MDAITISNNVVADKNRLSDVFQQTQNVTGGDVCAGSSPLATQIQSQIGAFSSVLAQLSATVDDTVGSFGDDLQRVADLVDRAEDGLSSSVWLYVALAVIALLDVIILAMLLVTCFSACGVSNGCTKVVTHAILWPVFSVFLFCAWIFSLLFLVTSLAGADFCVDPDAIVNATLHNYQDEFHSAIFGLAVYYTSGCQVEPTGMGDLAATSTEIQKALDMATVFSDTITGLPLPGLETQCGLGEAAATSLRSIAVMVNETSVLLDGVFIDLRRILECRTFNSIYTTFVHEALCVEGVNGLAWIFFTSLVVFLFGMLMLMFRAGLYPVTVTRAPEVML